MRLRDKVAIITGGGTGIGHATAILLAGEGATVMIAGVKQQTIEETAAAITSEGGRASCITTDVSKADAVERMVKATISAYGKIDILSNNAAVFVGATKSIRDLSEDEWDSLMAVNLKGVFLCCKYVIPEMIRKVVGRSSIVLPSQDTSASARWALTMQQREVWSCSANVWLLISLSTKPESTQSALAGWR